MKLVCKRCEIEMNKTIMDRYEYEKGVPLDNVEAYECKKCGNFVFTEEQIDELERMSSL